MDTVQFQKEIGEDDRLVCIYAAVGTSGPDHRSYDIDFDDVVDADTGETVSPTWFHDHIDELAEAVIHKSGDKILDAVRA